MGYGTGVGQRTAVVTGTSSLKGIGFHSALRYVQEGWAVAMLDINEAGAAAAAAEVLARVPEATVKSFAVDVTSEESVKAVAEAIKNDPDLPPVGALANIAGIPSPVPFLEVSLELWHRVVDINLTGTFLTCREFLPQMLEGGYGRIVNMSSVSAQQGGGVFSKTPYSAAKAGVLGLTRSLAREMAESQITVNAISPGAVDTDIRAGATDDENEARLSASVPMKRQAKPEEVAALVVFLSSEDAAYLTGTTTNINGGAYIA